MISLTIFSIFSRTTVGLLFVVVSTPPPTPTNKPVSDQRLRRALHPVQEEGHRRFCRQDTPRFDLFVGFCDDPYGGFKSMGAGAGYPHPASYAHGEWVLKRGGGELLLAVDLARTRVEIILLG